jgi:hypothetical protein
VKAYFGMRLLLQAVTEQPDRVGIKTFLDQNLNEGKASPSETTAAMKILSVRSGKVREFRVPRSSR